MRARDAVHCTSTTYTLNEPALSETERVPYRAEEDDAVRCASRLSRLWLRLMQEARARTRHRNGGAASFREADMASRSCACLATSSCLLRWSHLTGRYVLRNPPYARLSSNALAVRSTKAAHGSWDDASCDGACVDGSCRDLDCSSATGDNDDVCAAGRGCHSG